MMGAPLYDCATRQLTVRTTGGNGKPITYQIPSVTTGWEATSTFTLQNKHMGKELKLRARQRSTTGDGFVEVEINFTPKTCAGSRVASAEAGTDLRVVVLGNPVTDQEVILAVFEAEGQPLQLQLTDVTGRLVVNRSLERTQSG